MTPTRRRGRGNYSFLLFALIILFLAIFFTYGQQSQDQPVQVDISKIQRQYSNDELKKITIDSRKVRAELKSGLLEVAVKEPTATIADLGFSGENVDIEILDDTGNKFWIDLVVGLIPFILIALFLIFMIRQAQSGSQSALSFGKSRARLHDITKKRTLFSDVAGCIEAKEELVEIVDFLQNPVKYIKMGAKIPRGLILVGQPGTGKTLLARAVAGEANVPFFSISGSEFVEMFVGVGASRVRDLFNRAKKNSPCIIFIDEIDAVGRQRGAGMGGGNDEREQTLNQILVEMDGFDNETNVIVIAATNRPDVLDPALLRPGRFDRRVFLDMPDIQARAAILAVHARNKPLAKNVDIQALAKQTIGFSGADIENLMNEAAILAAKENKKTITEAHIEHSIDKVVLGPEKKSRIMNKEERNITAFHEAGHAIVAHSLPKCDPVQKVSIISRGMALGVTVFAPSEDRYLQSRAKFKQDLASMLGGYTAELLTFGDMTTGASNDLEKATKIARAMVLKYGMSESLGPVAWGEDQGSIFLGRELTEGKQYSEGTSMQIDAEITHIIKTALVLATDILTKKKKVLAKIAKVLQREETIDKRGFIKIAGKQAV